MAGLCKAQRGAGLDVSVLATWRQGQDKDIADDLAASGIAVTLVGPTRGPLSNHPQLASTLRDVIQANDVVHAHGIWEQVQHSGMTVCRELGKPYVVTPHGMLTQWSLRQKWLKKKIYMMLRLRRDLEGAAALHFTSATERDAVALLKLRPKVIVEPLGVDLREFESLPAKGSFRAKFPGIAGRKIVLFLGRVHPGKGLEYLIPALAAIERDDAMLVAVGPDSGGYQSVLKRMADENKVAQRVLFTGMLRGRDRIEALTDADIFAIPSEHENFGVVVVEALACGTPVIVSNGVALSGEVTAAGVGASVPVGDVPGLAKELKRWLGDDVLRCAAAKRARPFAFERFDWARLAMAWRDHYAQLEVR